MKYTANYFPVEKWEIIESKVCHFYNEFESPFNAVSVRVGDLVFIKTDRVAGITVERTPIIRWMTEAAYKAFQEESGVVIFE